MTDKTVNKKCCNTHVVKLWIQDFICNVMLTKAIFLTNQELLNSNVAEK